MNSQNLTQLGAFAFECSGVMLQSGSQRARLSNSAPEFLGVYGSGLGIVRPFRSGVIPTEYGLRTGSKSSANVYVRV